MGEKFQNRLRESLSQSSSCGSTSDLSAESMTELAIQMRQVPWKLAREKEREDGSRYIPELETQKVVEKMVSVNI